MIRDLGGRGLDLRKTLLRFGTFEVDLASGELRKQGVAIKLQEQPLRALVALAERPREVLTRDELQKRLWPPGTVVDFDRGLNKVINRLREALGDDADNARLIETLPLRGYRFLVDVEWYPSEAQAKSPPIPQPEPAPETVVISAGERNGASRRTLLAAIGGLVTIPAVYTGYRFLSHPPPKIDSIAVLPLDNLSGDRSQEYFSDGMTDELIGEIARIRSLRVISRTSVMRYKGGARKSLPQIARELNVDAILEGTVAQSGRKVRITAQLIRASDDRHLWSEKYESELGDVLALQNKVARAVAGEIEANLTLQERKTLARTRSVNPDAYHAFLKGNFFLYKGISGIGKSIEFFGQALRLDPSHSESYSGLAEALCYAGIFGLRPSAETYPEARRAALRALELDDSNSGAHNALGDVKQGYDWDLRGAEAEFKRSIQLNPSHLLTRLWYAECLSRMRRYDDSLAESARALELDPVSAASLVNRAMLFFRARRYDESIRTTEQALDLDPNIINAIWWQALSYAGKGNFPVAISQLAKAASVNDGPLFKSLIGFVYGLAGEKTKALAALKELTVMAKQRFVSPMDFAVVYAGLGDANGAFEWLEHAYQSRSIRISELRSMYFDSFRSDPRYTDLMHRIGLS